MSSLLHSRKFWLMVADVVLANVTYFVTMFLAPDKAEMALWLIGSWQPVIVAVIIGITAEDVALKNNAPFVDCPDV
jgi:hypothetical protein